MWGKWGLLLLLLLLLGVVSSSVCTWVCMCVWNEWDIGFVLLDAGERIKSGNWSSTSIVSICCNVSSCVTCGVSCDHC
jgi:hypothetical protein